MFSFESSLAPLWDVMLLGMFQGLRGVTECCCAVAKLAGENHPEEVIDLVGYAAADEKTIAEDAAAGDMLNSMEPPVYTTTIKSRSRSRGVDDETAFDEVPPRPASPLPEVSEEAPGEFAVFLNRRNNTDGLGLAVRGSATPPYPLVVTGVNGGLVEEWNRENPLSRVRVGDEVLEVNGERWDDAMLLLDRMKVARPLQLVLRRGSK
uniref:PDZ domain-containing protein n=1 Tax=Noctiluca scintillans TaxID=2966 RepID=A0A7S1AFF3_NOCSC